MANHIYEVQTLLMTGWENVWSDDSHPTTFVTEREAQDAIYEFFADLSRAGMSQSYDLEDYRVIRIPDAV